MCALNNRQTIFKISFSVLLTRALQGTVIAENDSYLKVGGVIIIHYCNAMLRNQLGNRFNPGFASRIGHRPLYLR